MELLELIPFEVYEEILLYLEGKDFGNLCASSKFFRDLCFAADQAFKIASHAMFGGCRKRNEQRWAQYFFEKKENFGSRRPTRVVNINENENDILTLHGNEYEVEKTETCFGLAVCGSGDGRFIATDPALNELCIIDLQKEGRKVYPSHGTVVYICWDETSTICTWISFKHGFFLRLHCLDTTNDSLTSLHSGAPLFWYLPAFDYRLALVHTNSKLTLTNLLGECCLFLVFSELFSFLFFSKIRV